MTSTDNDKYNTNNHNGTDTRCSINLKQFHTGQRKADLKNIDDDSHLITKTYTYNWCLWGTAWDLNNLNSNMIDEYHHIAPINTIDKYQLANNMNFVDELIVNKTSCQRLDYFNRALVDIKWLIKEFRIKKILMLVKKKRCM